MSVRPCCECARMTRSTRERPADFEFPTVLRRGDRCVPCLRASAGNLTSPTLENTIAGLRSFLRRRHERAATMARRDYYESRLTA